MREYTHTHTKKWCCTDKETKESDKKKGRNYGKEHNRKERSIVLPEGPIRNSTCNLWNLWKIVYRVYKNPLLVRVLSQLNTRNLHPVSLKSIVILYSHIRKGFPSGIFPPGVATKTLYSCFSPHCFATRSAYPLRFYLIVPAIIGEEHKSCNPALPKMCVSLATFYLCVDPSIVLNTLFRTCSSWSLDTVKDQVHTPYTYQGLCNVQ